MATSGYAGGEAPVQTQWLRDAPACRSAVTFTTRKHDKIAILFVLCKEKNGNFYGRRACMKPARRRRWRAGGHRPRDHFATSTARAARRWRPLQDTMRILNATDNGNIAVNTTNRSSFDDIDNYSWQDSDTSVVRINSVTEENVHFSNHNKYHNNIIDNRFSNTLIKRETNTEDKVCNKQFRLASNNIDIKLNINSKNIDLENKNLLVGTEWHKCCTVDANVSTDTTPADDERAFEQSDSDEMSENSVRPVPRGIVNPNYPGFQHLAHTLEDYSSNIEPFYHSENDMTDEDLETDIAETNCNSEDNPKIKAFETINNNNKEFDHVRKDNLSKDSKQTLPLLESKKCSPISENEIPDLLKTITHNNNNNVDCANYDFNCSATDIENNFHVKDIIGDFNKEVEDEIRHLYNYNLNIESDLEELRKDIKDTLVKPIENTINNISDVVNHVIKKLVENEGYEKNDALSPDIVNDHEMEDITNINKDNETNTRTEINISRPTFLYIDNNVDSKITDAILSDGKDEINIYEDDYDTDQLSQNVENTIKQLSTELRKIIPKLNEMRERDKIWNENKQETAMVIDGNSNNIVSTSNARTHESRIRSQLYDDKTKRNPKHKQSSTAKPHSIKALVESKVRQNSIKTPKAHNASVRKNDNYNETDFESFDVYNIETALPKLDLDTIENHIRAAKEAERRKRNDREEIRKRLAMGVDSEEYYSLGHIDRPGKKPSLHSRLQNGKNLQICFMNETASDNESQTSDIEKNFNCNSNSSSQSSLFIKNNFNHPYQTRPLSVNITKHEKNTNTQSGPKLRPTSLMLKSSKSRSTKSLGHIEFRESDFFALQSTLQTEARIALAQAKEMARIQMERERRGRAVSPVTEMLRRSMEKARAPLAPDRRRVSRHLLTDMNIAQLQVIVNELHSQIEALNDSLVKLLMARDELHMGQDSMLVDIEDLTRYLGVKEQTKKTKGTTKSGVRRLTSLVHK
ncbi:unnamed protein product, partial [Brenthis ino]